MKKKFILLLIMCIVFSSANIAYAQDNMEVTLVEPEGQYLVIGEELTYKLNIEFKRPLKDYQTMYLTFRFSTGLDYISSSFEGVTPVDGKIEATSNPNSEGRYSFLTVKVADMESLKGVNKFSVNIKAKLNDTKEEGSTLLNRVTVSYQLKDQVEDSQAKYYEISQESTATVTKARPVDQVLKIKTGEIFGKVQGEIEGTTNPSNRIQAKYLDKVEEVDVSENGSFLFRIPSGLQSDISISSLNETGNIFKTITVKYVDESTITKGGLDSFLQALRENGHTQIVDRYYHEYDLLVEGLDLIMGIEGGPVQEMYKLYENLYLATKTPLSQVLVHEPFMQGYPEGNFLPKNSITRAETAAILSRIIAKGEVTNRNSSFPDVENNKWFTKYIAHLAEEGIMKGYEDGQFKPQNKITRAEFATIVSRINNLTDYELVTFPDLSFNYWAANDILKVVSAGIMEGYPDKTFGPTLNVTRAEAATIINRMLNRSFDKNYIDSNNITGFSDIKNHWGYYQIVEATYRHSFVRNGSNEIYK